MKKIVLLSVVIFLTTINLKSQDRKFWFDLQLVQHVGLNKWHSDSYINDELYIPSTTYVRGTMNKTIGKSWGLFVDVNYSLFYYSSSKVDINSNSQVDIDNYYVVDSNELNDREKLGIGLTFGTFFKTNGGSRSKWSILPYIGVGFITCFGNKPIYSYVLKEKGSNNIYDVSYSWFQGGNFRNYTFGYLTSRINLTYNIARHVNLLFGIDYEFYFNRFNYLGKITDYYHGVSIENISSRGNYMNKVGFSVGVSFK